MDGMWKDLMPPEKDGGGGLERINKAIQRSYGEETQLIPERTVIKMKLTFIRPALPSALTTLRD